MKKGDDEDEKSLRKELDMARRLALVETTQAVNASRLTTIEEMLKSLCESLQKSQDKADASRIHIYEKIENSNAALREALYQFKDTVMSQTTAMISEIKRDAKEELGDIKIEAKDVSNKLNAGAVSSAENFGKFFTLERISLGFILSILAGVASIVIRIIYHDLSVGVFNQ